MILSILDLLGHWSMYMEITADTMNTTLLSSKTVKSKSKQMFLSIRKVWENWKMELNTWLWLNSDLYPDFLVAANRQALQLQLSQMTELAPISFLETVRSSTAVRKAIILVNASGNLAKLSWTTATNLASIQELKQ